MFTKIHVFRVKPRQEILNEITRYCQENRIHSGVVIGLIGSVDSAKLNFLKALPGKYETETYAGPLEIVCAQGSVALKDEDLIVHIHIQLSSQQSCWGGHLVEAKVFSTAEVVIGELDCPLYRYSDEYTGLNELIS
ncbi:MAG: DNA-binding protein [Chloroflexi bacterium]|nr:DNA-binding protein [Chloroflexota bacterium]